MEYNKASVQVIRLENEDVVATYTSAEYAAVDRLAELLGGLTEQQLEAALGKAGWNEGITGVLQAMEDHKISVEELLQEPINNGQLKQKHTLVCNRTTDVANSTMYSVEFEDDFDDAEW